MIWFRLLIGGLWKPIAAVIALAASWFGGRKAAKSDAKIKDLQREVKAHKTRRDVEDAAAADPDPRERLRADWQRK